jgi:TrmH family RNA methyltransferase
VLDVPHPLLPTGNVVVAWGVSDPGNTGALVRTAAAFGWAFAAGPGTADPWSPKVLRAGAGGHFHTAVGRVADLGDLGERSTVASVVTGGDPPAVLRGRRPLAVLIGDEGAGLPESVVAAADLRVTIPMPGGTESLNAAVAGAILVYEAAAGRD